jgi:hypothetical protein
MMIMKEMSGAGLGSFLGLVIPLDRTGNESAFYCIGIGIEDRGTRHGMVWPCVPYVRLNAPLLIAY